MAAVYALHLLNALGDSQARLPAIEEIHPAVSWARSGLMWLTGDERPQMCPVPLASCAEGALLALRALAPGTALDTLQGAQLLAERAALMGLQRQGRVAPGGSCRLLDTADGCLALNLARADDWAMLPAWLEDDRAAVSAGNWDALQDILRTRGTAGLVERGRMMGLAVAAESLPSAPESWYAITARGQRAVHAQPPLVIDLSGLWAGPLCGHLLQMLGARVIKVESAGRPDGARQGNSDFYDLLNAGKATVSLDFGTDQGRASLGKLIERADIVIESARPRGLRQMGIDAEQLVQSRPGLTWVSITGHGRTPDTCDWVAFGDDAGVAAGLTGLMDQVTGRSMFVGDAIADPLTGLHAALAAWHCHLQGGGRLLSLNLRDVIAHCTTFDLPRSESDLWHRYQAWSRMVNPADICLPAARQPAGSAPPMGADTDSVLAGFGLLH